MEKNVEKPYGTKYEFDQQSDITPGQFLSVLSGSKTEEIQQQLFFGLSHLENQGKIIDVREPEELSYCQITQQHRLSNIDRWINIPYGQLGGMSLEKFIEISKISKEKDNLYLLCSHGNRSVYTRRYLQSKGFMAFNVFGGTTFVISCIKKCLKK